MDKSKMTHKLAAALTAGILVSQGSTAAKATNFSTVTDNITASSSTLPNLIATVAYVGGLGMGVTGIFKLKQHVDNPGQTPMKDGLIRLGAGGALLVLPYITQAMMGTIRATDTGGGATVNTFGAANAYPG